MDSEITVNSTLNSNKAVASHGSTKEQKQLKEACRQFEGVLISMLLKEGLKTGPVSDEGEAPGEDIYKEYAIEQAAKDMGENESFGIAKMMYEQLSGEKENAL